MAPGHLLILTIVDDRIDVDGALAGTYMLLFTTDVQYCPRGNIFTDHRSA